MWIKPIQRVQMERIVRPFVVIDSAPPPPPTPRRPLPGEGDDAFISAGAPARFIRPELTEPIISTTPIGFGGGGFVVTWPDDEESKKPKQAPERIYQEIDRKVKKRRVENPEDAEQWVEVEDTTEIRFRAPAGGVVKFVFKEQK